MSSIAFAMVLMFAFCRLWLAWRVASEVFGSRERSLWNVQCRPVWPRAQQPQAWWPCWWHVCPMWRRCRAPRASGAHASRPTADARCSEFSTFRFSAERKTEIPFPFSYVTREDIRACVLSEAEILYTREDKRCKNEMKSTPSLSLRTCARAPRASAGPSGLHSHAARTCFRCTFFDTVGGIRKSSTKSLFEPWVAVPLPPISR